MSVIIFYTNIQCTCGVEEITPTINAIAGIIRWTIDLSDSDKVLRVVAHSDVTAIVSKALRQHGYESVLALP